MEDPSEENWIKINEILSIESFKVLLFKFGFNFMLLNAIYNLLNCAEFNWNKSWNLCKFKF